MGYRISQTLPASQPLRCRQGPVRERQPPTRHGRIATGNYDTLIVSFRSFESLPLSDKLFDRFLDEEIQEIDEELLRAKTGADDNRRIVKQLEAAKKRLQVRFRKRANRENKDNTVTFEDLGISQLMVDEADAYKNLAYISKMQRIAGLPNSDSFRAFDMFLKIRYIRQNPQTRGVVFATGTPISNTLAEMYTVLRYLALSLLESTGTSHFDAWAANFAEAVTALELAPDGSGYRMNTRFARFINMPELLSMFRTVADIQTADMLQLPRPELETGRPIVEAAPGQRHAQELHPDPGQASRRFEERENRPERRQHAQDYRRRPESGPRSPAGRFTRTPRARYQTETGHSARLHGLARNGGRPRSAAHLLRLIDTRPHTLECLQGSTRAADASRHSQTGDRFHSRCRHRC